MYGIYVLKQNVFEGFKEYKYTIIWLIFSEILCTFVPFFILSFSFFLGYPNRAWIALRFKR